MLCYNERDYLQNSSWAIGRSRECRYDLSEGMQSGREKQRGHSFNHVLANEHAIDDRPRDHHPVPKKWIAKQELLGNDKIDWAPGLPQTWQSH